MVVVGGYEAAEGRTVLGRAMMRVWEEFRRPGWKRDWVLRRIEGERRSAVTGLLRVTEPVREG